MRLTYFLDVLVPGTPRPHVIARISLSWTPILVHCVYRVRTHHILEALNKIVIVPYICAHITLTLIHVIVRNELCRAAIEIARRRISCPPAPKKTTAFYLLARVQDLDLLKGVAGLHDLRLERVGRHAALLAGKSLGVLLIVIAAP